MFRAPRHPYTYGLVNSFPSLHGVRDRLTGIPGSPPDLGHLPPGCAFHPRCQWARPVCSEVDPRLEPVGAAATRRWRAGCTGPPVRGAVPPQLSQPEPLDEVEAAPRSTRPQPTARCRPMPEPDVRAPDPGDVPVLRAVAITKHFPVRGGRRARSFMPWTASPSTCGRAGQRRGRRERLRHRPWPGSWRGCWPRPPVAWSSTAGPRGLAAARRPAVPPARADGAQDPFASLNPVHTVHYHLERPVRIHGRARGGTQVDAAVEALERVKLTRLASTPASSPTSCPAGSASGSPSPGPSPSTRRSCSPTSRVHARRLHPPRHPQPRGTVRARAAWPSCT